VSWLADPSVRILEGALDGLSQRESLIASNLANIDTPGYRPQSIDFESALRTELDSRAAALGLVTTGSSGSLQPPSTGPSAAIALRTTDPRHFAGTASAAGSTLASQGFDGSLRNDGNTVDLESEMTALVSTQLRFGAVSELVTGKLAMLRTAIGGR
jgi:flagellar basal-body rod protein FlgB